MYSASSKSLLRTRLVGLATLVAVSLTLTQAPSLGHHREHEMDIVAHRGDVEHYAANSWRAIDSAVSKGADWVEIDVHRNIESGEFVLSHENECIHLSAGSKVYIDTDPWEHVLGCSLPNLEAVFSTYASTYRSWMIDVKPTWHTAGLMGPAVARLVNKYGLDYDVWATAAHPDLKLTVLRGIRDTGSPIKLMLGACPRSFFSDWFGLCETDSTDTFTIDTAVKERFEGANIHIDDATSSGASYAATKGIVYSMWTWHYHDWDGHHYQRKSHTDHAQSLGADMFFTDFLDYSLNYMQYLGHGGSGSTEEPCEDELYAPAECV